MRFCVWAGVIEGMRRGGAVSCWLLDDEPCVMEGARRERGGGEGKLCMGSWGCSW